MQTFNVLKALVPMKGKRKLPLDKLNHFMARNNVPQFTYETLAALYDANVAMQNIVADFDQETITLSKDKADVDPSDDLGGSADTVKNMAKNATDLSDL